MYFHLWSVFNCLYICLQVRIISFSVVNMTEKSRCCQLDLRWFFSMIGKKYLQELLSFLYAMQLHCLFNEIRIIIKPLTIAIFQLETVAQNLRLINDHFTTNFSNFFAIYLNTFHKTEI